MVKPFCWHSRFSTNKNEAVEGFLGLFSEDDLTHLGQGYFSKNETKKTLFWIFRVSFFSDFWLNKRGNSRKNTFEGLSHFTR